MNNVHKQKYNVTSIKVKNYMLLDEGISPEDGDTLLSTGAPSVGAEHYKKRGIKRRTIFVSK